MVATHLQVQVGFEYDHTHRQQALVASPEAGRDGVVLVHGGSGGHVLAVFVLDHTHVQVARVASPDAG